MSRNEAITQQRFSREAGSLLKNSKACDQTRLQPIILDGHAYLLQLDRCGAQVGQAFKLGTCSVDSNGKLYPFNDNGDQIISFEDTAVKITEDASSWYIEGLEGISPVVCKKPLKGGDIVSDDGVKIAVDVDANGRLQLKLSDFKCSTTTDNGDGTKTITTDDGISFNICERQYKGTAYNAELKQWQNIDQSGDPFGEAWSHSTSFVSNGETTTTHPDGTAHTSCNAPVKAVSGNIVDNTNSQNPVINESLTKFAQDLAGVITYTDEFDQSHTANTNHILITEASDGKSGTITNSITGRSCTFLKQVDIPEDVKVTDYGMTETTNPDGSKSYQFTITMSNGTVFPAGPVIDMDKFGSVVDNGNGTGSVADPVTSLICAFQKPLIDSASNQIAADGVTLNPLLDCNSAPLDLTNPDSKFVVYSQLATIGLSMPLHNHDFGDDGCSPVEPSAKLLGLGFTSFSACSPRGDLWEYSGGVWDIKNVNPCTRRFRAITTHNDINNDALLALTMGVAHDFDETCVEVTNDDCVPWRLELGYRYIPKMVLANGSTFEVSVKPTSGVTNADMGGSPTTRYDKNCNQNNTSNCNTVLGGPVEFGKNSRELALLNPGQSRTFCFVLRIFIANYTSDPQNQYQGEAFSLWVDASRQKSW